MTPDLETQLERLAAATDPAGDPIDIAELVTRRRTRRPLRLGAVALRVAAGILVIGVVAAAVAAVADDPGRRERTYVLAPPTASESTNADLLDPGAARALPPAPIEGRESAAIAWTGTEVFVWGGNDESAGRNFADGATFDVRRDEWTLLPPSPLGPRDSAQAVWTGTEVIVWGGFVSKGQPQGEDPERADGAAYDPRTRTWRSITEAPFAGDTGADAVWTGEEMVVLTGSDPAAGAAYDPTQDSWRPIAEPPAPLAQPFTEAAWTGTRVVASLGATDSAEVAVYAYDPVDDAWEEYGRPDGAARPDRLVWTGDGLLQVPVDRPPSARDGVTGRWEVAGEAPPAIVATTRRAPLAVWTGERVVAWGPGFVAAFDPADGTWTVAGEDRQPTDADAGAAVVWADGVLFVWGGFPDVADGSLIRPPASTAPGADAGAGDASGVEFRPVLESGLPYDASAAAAGGDPCAGSAAGDTTAVPDRVDPDSPPVACVRLGPVGFTGDDLSHAVAVQGSATGGDWVVRVAVASEERARADELFDACAHGATTCPADPADGTAGRMAIVVDGEVISAPTVQAPDLADQELVIAGGGSDGFTEAEARQLATRLDP